MLIFFKHAMKTRLTLAQRPPTPHPPVPTVSPEGPSSPQSVGACWEAPTGPARLQDLRWQPQPGNQLPVRVIGKEGGPAGNRNNLQVFHQQHLKTVTQNKEVQHFQNPLWEVCASQASGKNKKGSGMRCASFPPVEVTEMPPTLKLTQVSLCGSAATAG